jgi:hypothetical protein
VEFRDVKGGLMGPIMLLLKLNYTLLTAMLRNLSKVKDRLMFLQSMQKVGTLMFSLVRAQYLIVHTILSLNII